MTARTLRVATEADAKKAVGAMKPKSLVEATASGNRREFLDAMCREIAADIRSANAAAKAALYRRLYEAKTELDALMAAAEQDAAEDAQVADESFDAEAL